MGRPEGRGIAKVPKLRPTAMRPNMALQRTRGLVAAQILRFVESSERPVVRALETLCT